MLQKILAAILAALGNTWVINIVVGRVGRKVKTVLAGSFHVDSVAACHHSEVVGFLNKPVSIADVVLVAVNIYGVLFLRNLFKAQAAGANNLALVILAGVDYRACHC